MQKIIVRNKILNRGYVNSSYINLCNNIDYNSIEDFIEKNEIKKIMKIIFCEDIDCELLENSDLYQSYSSVVKSKKDNDLFNYLYKIDDEFALHITENIYLYHLIPKNNEIYSLITPWFYADSKKYFGDSWWEDDIEIIDNLNNLSILDFLKRYKGY